MTAHKLHVLVVEDEASLVELLRYNLEKEGFRVTVANDGEEALALLKEGKPDLMVLDWMLPHVSGIEICRQVRRRAELRDLPVIMLTARGEEADRVRGLEVGADDYVIKPFSPSELVARIRAVLRRARPGAAERLAATQIARMKPDGSVVYLMTGGQAVVSATDKTLQYDLLRDFDFIGIVTRFPFSFTVIFEPKPALSRGMRSRLMS